MNIRNTNTRGVNTRGLRTQGASIWLSRLKRFWLLGLIVIALIAFWVSGADRFLDPNMILDQRDQLGAWVDAHYLPALLLFILAYIGVVALFLPATLLMSLLGGLLFGTLQGFLAIIVSATIGAAVLFIAAKTAFHETLSRKAGPALKALEQGFQKDAFNYLLFLRLVPAFPFFIVNLVPALLGVPLRVFMLATFIGIIPGSFVYAFVGDSFNHVDEVSLTGILQPEVILAFSALGILALVPVIHRRFFKKDKKPAS